MARRQQVVGSTIVSSTNNPNPKSTKESDTMTTETTVFNSNVAVFEAALVAVKFVAIPLYTDVNGIASKREFLPLSPVTEMSTGNHLVWGLSKNVEYLGETPENPAPEFHKLVVEGCGEAVALSTAKLPFGPGRYFVPFKMVLHFGSHAADNNCVKPAVAVNKTFVIGEDRMGHEVEVATPLSCRKHSFTINQYQTWGYRLLHVQSDRAQWEVMGDDGHRLSFVPWTPTTQEAYVAKAERQAARRIF
jgi:hypothetical protein